MAAVKSDISSIETPISELKPAEKAYVLEGVWFRKPHGAHRYREYLEAASPIASQYGAHRVDALFWVETLRGDVEPDYICVIEWPSIDQYYKFLKDIHYRAVAPIKEEAVDKVITLHCRRV
ncbi:MAG TPA: DUF1330 domain-containing protein [Candidatus Hydrogenedentes bacterium]|nr:DUF1330 domain-containing protein [Candidatus Hydrogenedentota bacterium]